MMAINFLCLFYLITLFGSTPQFAAITTFGSACSILVQSSLAANPLKTFLNINETSWIIIRNIRNMAIKSTTFQFAM